MDYEKKYKEALEKLREFHRDYDTVSLLIDVKEELENIFPELAESEDERMLREIKKYIKEQGNKPTGLPNGTAAVADMLAWLEKQGKSSDQIHYWTEEEIEPIISDYLRGAEHYGGMIGRLRCLKPKSLEKQGEANPYSGVSFKYNGHTWGMCARDNGVEILVDGEIKERVFLDNKPQGKSALEAIKEEVDNQNCVKPADKVEPKYKVKDWVTNNIETVQITGYDIDYGYQVDYKGNLQHRDTDIIEKEYHLWTIQDAKDGDVLSNGKMIVIFKHFEEPSYRQRIVAYIGLDNGGDIQITDDTWTLGIDKEKPATKEQRDTLEKAMADAGYTFDFEKKELKKIEQSELTEFEDSVKDMMDAYRDAICANNVTIEEVKKHAAYMMSLIHHKPAAWSEEDEYTLKGIVDEIEANKNSAPDYDIETYDRFLNWLKSIKQRIGG